jgi:(2R)-sulfolactate sulfo-lyase subunit alpha
VHNVEVQSGLSLGKYLVSVQKKRKQGKAKRNKLGKIPQFLVHNSKDNVGVVVVEDLEAGTKMLGVITEDDSTTNLSAKDDIPIGHKVALTDLKAGDTVIKYGEDVGVMTGRAKKGEHVHTHNLKTKKW